MKKEIELAIAKQQDKIKALKATKADKALLQPLISELTGLKEKLKSLNLSFDRTQLESVLAKRFFVTPSFAIYGGVAGLFDYGPPGCALQNNLLDIWRQHFCLEEDMLEIETTNLTPESVFKVSGHVDRFADYMVTDSVTGDIFRADHLIKLVLNRRLDTDKNVRLGLQKPPLNHSPLSNELIDEYNYVLETVLFSNLVG
jgi:glycyl-tRNA synthetase